jgi:hypothetical protein
VSAEAADPFAVLGLPPSADAEAVRLARRRLAMAEHPDHGGDGATMQAINVAFEQAMARLQGVAPVAPPPAADAPPAPSAPPAEADGGSSGRRTGQRYVERDEPSFVIEALPAEAFEALLIAGTVLGEVVMDDPPYVLEVRVVDPGDCWCRLELLPEAGGSTVMLTVAGVEGIAPSLDAVRDRWIETLNGLGELER